VVKYLKGRNPLINDLEGDLNVDSDCEGDPIGTWGGMLEEEENEEETRAVLVTGSFSAYVSFLTPPYAVRNDRFSSWRSLFFYRCTDMISFARLKSQDISSRTNKISTLPPPPGPPPSAVFDISTISTWFPPPALPVVDAPASPIIPLPVPQQPQVTKPRKKSKVDGRLTPSEPQGVKPRKAHILEMPVVTPFPPCSPRSVYVLATLVRQPSTGFIG